MIKCYNRNLKKYENENIAGYSYLKWTYSSPVGMKLLELIIKKKIFSKLYGEYCNSRLSKKKIHPFIKNFKINMNESVKNETDFKNFNEFFTRKLKPNARPIEENPNHLISPGDGRISAHQNIDMDNIIQVKGITYKLKDLVSDEVISKKFENGSIITLRLSPVDYHRFHFIDSGFCSTPKTINGNYYSVNPIALVRVPDLFCRNERQWSILHSKNFGDILYVEVGATCVGTIIQTYNPHKYVKKGEEKGFFKFGGSTIILFFEKNKIKIDADILEQTKSGFETKVLMGEKIGSKL